MHLPNLLPEEQKRSYRIYLFNLYLKRILFFQASVALVVILILGSQYFFLQFKLASLRSAIVTLKQIETRVDTRALEEAANAYNGRLQAASTMLGKQNLNSPYLDELARIIPQGITLDTLDFNAAISILEIKGRAARREQVVLLQSRIESSEIFILVFAPLGNLTESVDGPFHFILKGNKL